jgi:signal transduction histidine kinase
LLFATSCRDPYDLVKSGVSLDDRIEMLEDRQGTLSLEEISSGRSDGSFRGRKGPINLGLTQSAYWFRVRLEPQDFAGDDRRWIVTLGANADQLDPFATSDPGGRGEWQRLQIADSAKNGAAAGAYELPRNAAKTAWLLFRAKSLDALIFSPRLSEAAGYVSRNVHLSLRRGVYYGVVGGAIVYNLFLAIWLRDRTYRLYVLFESLICVTTAGMDSTLATVLPAAYSALKYGLTEGLMAMTGIAAVFFARDFLDLRDSRRIAAATKVTVVTGVLLVLFPFWLGRQALYVCVYAFSISTSVLVLVMAIFAWRRGNENAPLFVLAWAMLLSAVVVGSLKNLGLLAPGFSVMDAIRFGSGAEALLLALALVRRMSLMRRAEEDARSQLADARAGLSKVLKRQIASLNTLIGGVAHEIGNPLNFAAGGAKDAALRLETAEALAIDLGRGWNADRYRSLRQALDAAGRSAALAARGTARIDGIIRNLRGYVGTGSKPTELTDLDECIRRTVSLLEARLRARGIEVVLNLGLRARVQCCPAELNQVFTNLVWNAYQAMPEGGQIVIFSEEAAGALRVVVSDTGHGVPASQRQAIFDPFFTTRAPNEGTGLGLAVSLEIIRRHGGKLELLPAREHVGGAAFAITLPRS